MKIAFAGFRHGHINCLYTYLQKRGGVEIVAACEEDASARADAEKAGVKITHRSIEAMLQEVDCDAVAVGDYYSRRGGIVLAALQSGRHVIADKPLCTDLAELARIEALAAERGRRVGLMLDLRDQGVFIKIRELVRSGAIGEVHAATIWGQHPLGYAARPKWYFEPGKHGGTINDIGIHAVDIVPWITGLRVALVNAAKSWNSAFKREPRFHDAGQALLSLENGAGLFLDVSYLSPDSFGYTFPLYWKLTLWGGGGVIEGGGNLPNITLYRNGAAQPEAVAPEGNRVGRYFENFLDEVEGRPVEDAVGTAAALRASRAALLAQQAGAEGLANLAV